MKTKMILFWLVVTGVLFAFLQINFRYHFFYIEQGQLFQQTGAYILDKLSSPGGGALALSEYLVQFFVHPFAGPGIVALLLAVAGICTERIIQHIAPRSQAVILYLLPVITLLFVQFDFNYRLYGTVAYDLMLLFFLGYINFKSDKLRLVVGFLLVPLLFWLAGSVSLLFALLLVGYELQNKTPKGFWILLAGVEIVLLGLGSVWFSMVGEYRFAFLPDAYYHKNLTPENVIYFSWLSWLLILPLSFFMKTRKKTVGKNIKIGGGIIQFILIVSILYWGLSKYDDKKSAKLKELDYYSRHEQWDNIIEISKGSLSNYLYICHLNMALAQKGELADKMFSFDQRGIQGIMVAWNKSENISCLLSDLYFTMGNIAQAQEMAFEAYLCAMGEGNPRMLKRLIQTNLIYGTYPVAEKYIRILENTHAYKQWALSQRKFLHNDQEVEQDPLLGSKRKSLPKESDLSQLNGLHMDLLTFAKSNPLDRAPINYLGALYLLTKDLEGFQKLIEEYYGTDILPELPVSFQEAIITLSEKDPDYWKRFHISESIRNRFDDYKKQVLANRNNSSALPGLLRRAYGDTYWFYFMFK